ncbi:MAG TPA: hypothetical protein VF831_01455 [Anaerolineales bacterium]
MGLETLLANALATRLSPGPGPTLLRSPSHLALCILTVIRQQGLKVTRRGSPGDADSSMNGQHPHRRVTIKDHLSLLHPTAWP